MGTTHPRFVITFSFLASLVWMVLTPVGIFAYTETFYVCQGGSGSNPKDGTAGNAFDAADLAVAGNWSSAEAAVDNKIGPGDRLYFMHNGGDITSTGPYVLDLLKSGTAANHITLEGDGVAVLNGENTRPVLDGSDRDYIDIRKLKFKNALGSCVSAYDSEHWTIESCEIGPGAGNKQSNLLFCGTDWLVSDCYIHDSALAHGAYCYSKTGAYGSSDIVFEYNHFANSFMDNLKFNGVDVHFTGVVVRYNLFENGGWCDLDLSTTDNAKVYGNAFIHTISGKWQGIVLGDDTQGTAHVKNTRIWNNLFYGLFEAAIMMMDYHVVGVGCISELYNNIFFLKGGAGSGGTHFIYFNGLNTPALIAASNNNVFYSTNGSGIWHLEDDREVKTLTAWRAAMRGFDTLSFDTDPQFVGPGPSLGDFQLQASSPCYRTARDVGLKEDFNGVLIPQDTAPDIGPFERPSGIVNPVAAPKGLRIRP